MRFLRTAVFCAGVELLCFPICFGQTKELVITVNDPRPLAAAALQIEQLSHVPINYEDPILQYSADLEDVTDKVISANEKVKVGPNFHIVGARGGELTQTVLVDENMSQPIETAVNALNGFVAAEQSSLSQRFVLERGNGVIYVEPSGIRDQSGTLRDVVPVLAARISFPYLSRNAFQTLQLILKLTSEASGFKIAPGTMPIRPFAASDVTMGAQDEPARSIIVHSCPKQLLS